MVWEVSSSKADIITGCWTFVSLSALRRTGMNEVLDSYYDNCFWGEKLVVLCSLCFTCSLTEDRVSWHGWKVYGTRHTQFYGSYLQSHSHLSFFH